jgi:hypothetical protein
MLLFPNGHLLSLRWRVVAWAAVLGAALAALTDGFYPGRLATHGYVENPLGVMGMIGQELTILWLPRRLEAPRFGAATGEYHGGAVLTCSSAPPCVG